MSHRNVPLTPTGRLRLCQRIEAGFPVAHVAEHFNVSRPTAYKWWRRYQVDGEAGLHDRSSRPHRCPARPGPRPHARSAPCRSDATAVSGRPALLGSSTKRLTRETIPTEPPRRK